MEESKPRILIVEDQKISARDLTIILGAAGYEVCGSFSNGKETIEQVGNLAPDVILLDICISGEIDGIQLAEYLKLFYDIPFIYLTANSDPETIGRAAKTKPQGFITKPFHPEQLIATIGIALPKNTKSEPKGIYSYGRFSKIVQYLKSHLDQEITLSEMAQVMNMNSSYFCRAFQQEIGLSPYQFILQLRIEKAKELLKESPEVSISDIALTCGFSSQNILNKHFRKFVGITPTQYRKQC